jgi:hypothetical protein
VAATGGAPFRVALLLVPDDVDVLGRGHVVVGRKRGLPLGTDRFELDDEVLGTSTGGVATAHGASSRLIPDGLSHRL